MPPKDPYAQFGDPVAAPGANSDPYSAFGAPVQPPQAIPSPNQGLAPAAGAPPRLGTLPNAGTTGEGPLARGMTSMETQLSSVPPALANMIRTSWMEKPQQGIPTAGEQLLNPNPIVRSRASLTPQAAAAAQAKGSPNPIDWGATTANLLPLVTDIGGRGITESPAAGIARGAGSTLATAGGIVKGAAKASGIGLTPIEKLVKAAGPSVREANFPQALETASPRLAEQNAAQPVKTVQDMSDAAHAAADNLWKNHVEPQITRNAKVAIDGRPIAAQIRAGVGEGMQDLFPDQAKTANAFADKFENNIPLSKANEYLKTINAQLKSFYKMSPEARAAAGVTDGRLSSMENAADGLRQQMYSKLDSLGETDPAGLRQQYGALKQVQSVFGKRAIVAGRQAPLNLPQLVAIAGGAGEGASALFSGHPGAALASAAPIAATTLLKYFNSPDVLTQRGISGLEVPPPLRTTPPEPIPTPRSLGAAAAQPAPELPQTLREAAGLERRATLRSAPMNATELEAAIKGRKPVQTPFDVTEGAQQTINQDIKNRLQGGHAGGGAASVEELNRPGQNYVVGKNGNLTYHGKAFAPESIPKGSAHVTVLPNGEFQVNAGDLTPSMRTSLKNGLQIDTSSRAIKAASQPVRDTEIMAHLEKEHPEWSLSQRLQEAAKIAKKASK